MFFNLVKFKAFSLIFVTIYIFTISQFVVSQNSVIDLICDGTPFSEFCKDTLYLDHRSQMATSKVVGEISIDLTIGEIHTVSIFVKDRLHKTYHELYKSHLEACNNTCDTIIDDINQAKILWDEGNILETKIIVKKSARALSKTCQQKVQGQKGGVFMEKITRLLRILYIVEAVCELFELMIPVDYFD